MDNANAKLNFKNISANVDVNTMTLEQAKMLIPGLFAVLGQLLEERAELNLDGNANALGMATKIATDASVALLRAEMVLDQVPAPLAINELHAEYRRTYADTHPLLTRELWLDAAAEGKTSASYEDWLRAERPAALKRLLDFIEETKREDATECCGACDRDHTADAFGFAMPTGRGTVH